MAADSLLTEVEDAARPALEWLAAGATAVPGGVGWTRTPERDDVDPTLYTGGAGNVLALLDGFRHFEAQSFGDTAARGAAGLSAAVDDCDHQALYFGRAGIAFTLDAAGRLLGEDSWRRRAREVLRDIHHRYDGERWSMQIELLGGNAGIALAALAIGEVELAEAAVAPYVRLAEPTEHGVTWEGKTGLVARFHHISHGTLGIVSALAAVADRTRRDELLDLALAGAADVVGRNEAGAGGFLVPHSDPQHRPELVERYSYGWCHGPAGDAQTFRLLHQVTGDEEWLRLQDRCWSTVIGSGVPERVRLGFWDNNGRCCGTAGVLALANDRMVERGDDGVFADVLVRDLLARATTDADGVRWQNVEHREDPSTLPPEHGWAMGNAGIVRELLRYSRIRVGRDPDYAVTLPDQPVARTPSAR
ncbi:lanthionine synthetase LanC family protein [Luteipulveratus flavus]|uniref:Lanthionine synthetase LanC family protein n=1 Tax=Luteipulveratus flavus TaxID=3031728 RepID=A0ABT6C973_9MICO|nr:lanthionine synthetase LanC family protein [Luteipulveratus sp. YIM 133296]MDF8264887.1 lanthionine synthetase LanC family protein [Luteipulveratus sp. YIM 133296]